MAFKFTYIRTRFLLIAFAFVVALLAMMGSSAKADATRFDNYAFRSTGASLSTLQAGAHADFTTEFVIDGAPGSEDFAGQRFPWAGLRDFGVELPPGLTGNPEAFPKCNTTVFYESIRLLGDPSTPQCPVDSQIGVVKPGVWESFPMGELVEPLYNLPSPGGDVVARLGFLGGLFPIFLDVKVDPARDDALTVELVNDPGVLLTGSITTVWGAPTDSSHDGERFANVLEPVVCATACEPHASSLKPTPYMSNPTSCGPVQVGFTSSSYAETVAPPATAQMGEITGCESVPFEPAASFLPTTTQAGSPSGMDVSIKLDQSGLYDPDGKATAHLKRAVVTLPEGMSLNPSAADGLASCTEAQVGLTSTNPIRFNAADPSCPNASKVGTAEIATPLLEDPLVGSLFLADQDDNPFDSLLSGYLVAKGEGVTIKVAGSFQLDPRTGRIVATFDNNPQQPFTEVALHFKGGNRGVLTTPAQCGTYGVDYELTPWSGNPPTVGTSKFTIDQGCNAAGEFKPGFRAGSGSALAGAFGSFALQVTRASGTPRLTGVSVDPPLGLTAMLAGIPYCPDSALNGVSGDLGTGARELSSPSCPAASQVGTVAAGAGSGSPFYVNTGRAYLAGPYKGAPFSLAIVTPAVTGPFDLGSVMVRTAIHIDPATAQVHAVSDPLPTILQGIPLDLRDLRVVLDRQGFTINPTSCAEKSVTGRIEGSGGLSASVSDRFQLGECSALGFKPRIGLSLKGGTTRGKHPALQVVLRPRSGDANIKSLSVALPHSEFLDQSHIGTVCTRVQFAADACPAASVYGEVSVRSPLVDYPLTGKVYLRSSNHKLPDLVPDLRGPAWQPIKLEAAARTDSVNGGLRSTAGFVPDAPFSKLVLRMRGGKKGLLQNSTNICDGAFQAIVKYSAHNGDTYQVRPKLKASCNTASKGGRHSGRR